MINYRRLRRDETAAAADLHRRAGALIPGYDMSDGHDNDERMPNVRHNWRRP